MHDEDNGDKGGNDRHVILDGHPDNLHWVWDTGLLERIDRNPQALAAELESRITDRDRAAWTKGSVEDWVLEGHRLAQTVAYADLSSGNPAVIGAEYERQAPRDRDSVGEGWCAAGLPLKRGASLIL